MAPIPEIGHAARRARRRELSTPEEIAAFNANSLRLRRLRPFSQTRADIDDFLRQRAARETQSQAAQQLLSPPSEDRAAPATAAPQAGAPPSEAPVAPAAATGPLDQDFSSYKEPGRAAPRRARTIGPCRPSQQSAPEQAAASPAAQDPEAAPEKPPEPPESWPGHPPSLAPRPAIRRGNPHRYGLLARGHEDAVAAHGAGRRRMALSPLV